jgi:UPF0716 protein FxsA
MRELRLFIQFIENDFLFKLIGALLVYALVPFAEIIFFIYLGNLIGNWLVLVLAVVAGLPGVLIAHSQLQEVLQRLRAKLRDGQYPGAEFVDLLGLLVGGIFLLTPGFITDALGYLLLVPLLRGFLGRALARKMSRRMRDFYDYLRLNEL